MGKGTAAWTAALRGEYRQGAGYHGEGGVRAYGSSRGSPRKADVEHSAAPWGASPAAVATHKRKVAAARRKRLDAEHAAALAAAEAEADAAVSEARAAVRAAKTAAAAHTHAADGRAHLKASVWTRERARPAPEDEEADGAMSKAAREKAEAEAAGFRAAEYARIGRATPAALHAMHMANADELRKLRELVCRASAEKDALVVAGQLARASGAALEAEGARRAAAARRVREQREKKLAARHRELDAARRREEAARRREILASVAETLKQHGRTGFLSPTAAHICRLQAGADLLRAHDDDERLCTRIRQEHPGFDPPLSHPGYRLAGADAHVRDALVDPALCGQRGE